MNGETNGGQQEAQVQQEARPGGQQESFVLQTIPRPVETRWSWDANCTQ